MALDKPHPDYEKAVDGWRLVRDCVEGSRVVKKAGERYLPMLYEQEAGDYEKMKKRALFFGATEKTLNAFEGFIFRVNPEFKNPDVMKEFMRDCTMTGVSFYDYCKQVARDVISVGRTGTLIDWDDPANEDRPFLLRYDTEDIVDWQYRRINGHTILSRIVLYECNSDAKAAAETGLPPDEYSKKTTERWRVYEIEIDSASGREYAVCRIWERVETGSGKEVVSKFVLVDKFIPNRRLQPLQRIPFIFHNVSGDQAKPDKIPMEGFADTNISHYRTSADIEGALHVCGQPTPYAIGFGEGVKVLGSAHAWVSDNVQAKAGFLELTGASLAPLERAMERKEKQMAALGARMLESQSAARSAEAFETVQIRQSGEVSALSNITIMCTQTLSKAMQLVAWWMSAEETPDDFVDKVFVELNTDFVSSKLDAPTLTAVLQAFMQGAISYDVLFDILQRGQIIGSERTIQEELAAIKKEEAERQAKADAEAARAAEIAKAGAGKPPGQPPGGG